GMLDGRVALVTGASSGIGRAAALRLAEEGATVVAIARRKERLRALSHECSRILVQGCDVTDHVALSNCVSRTVTELGRLDILVNNAGFSYYERLEESTLEHWRAT